MFTFANKSNGTHGLVYAALVAAAVICFFVVISIGAASSFPQMSSGPAHLPPAPETALHLLRALLALLLTSSLLAAGCRLIHQPPVIGEILAGICLGPSLLGRLAPSLQAYIIPADVTPQLGTVAQIGIIMFMFLVGLELDISVMKSNSRSTLAISHASIVVPFVLGCIAALWLYPSLGTPSASFPVFTLFLGVSLSVTAFPVLARILADHGLTRSPMGVVALTCAAVDDVTAWCLLALLVGVAKANAWDALVTCVSSVVYIATLFWFVRPALSNWANAPERRALISRTALASVLVALLVSSLITEHIGIHAIFGAFLLGAIIPHDSSVAKALTGRFNDLVVVLFMPAFYALVGLQTEIGLVDGWSEWFICGVIILLACLGKFGGSYMAARLMGVERSTAASIGVLMNTRGLMELVVLDLGFKLGIISSTLFAMMVVMALVTTSLTSPLLRLTRAAASPQPSPLAGAPARRQPHSRSPDHA